MGSHSLSVVVSEGRFTFDKVMDIVLLSHVDHLCSQYFIVELLPLLFIWQSALTQWNSSFVLMGYFITTLHSLHWLGITFGCFPSILLFLFKLFNVSVPTFPVTSLLTCAAGKDQDKTQGRRSRAPSLAETEEALAQAVWCWAGIATWVWLMYLTYLWTAMSWVCQWFPNSVSSLFQWQQLFPASRRCSRIVPLVSTSEKTQVWLSDRPLPLRPDHSPHRKHS